MRQIRGLFDVVVWRMKWRAIAAIAVLLVVVASVVLMTTVQGTSESAHIITTLQPAADEPRPAVALIGGLASAEPVESSSTPRWGRAEVTWDPEHYPPNRSDWSDIPEDWELRSVALVPEIPAAVRRELERLDCTIPRYRHGTVEGGVIWGQLERPGQRDLAVLCVHADQTSSTYVFWAGDPARRDVMPQSGSSIGVAVRADVVKRLDPDKPLDPDMPASVDHDALEIGCCECCSTIFYRHSGQWFTLPGAD